MSRRSQVVRNYGVTDPSAPRSDTGFTWNAQLSSSSDVTLASDEEAALPAELARHSSFGADVDFDADLYPYNRIVIPVDGVYSVSARAALYAGESESIFPPRGALFAVNSGSIFPLVDEDADYAGSSERPAYLHVSHAGTPLHAGDRVWVRAANLNETPITIGLRHLSVTYEAELGTEWGKEGP